MAEHVIGKVHEMDQVEKEVLGILHGVLGPSAGGALDVSSALVGVVADLDSMAVVAILASIEERFGFSVNDDEVDGTTFASVGSLVGFVRAKLSA